MTKKKKNKEIIIPPKIKEIISYLGYSFSSGVLDKDDIKQDLYVLYLEMMQKDKRAKDAQPGYFFIKFKWFLKTKYRKEINRINKMWDYLTTYCNHAQRTKIGYVQSEFNKPKVSKKKKRRKRDR